MAQKLLTRDKYKELKKMDRQKAETFICSIYESGWKNGLEAGKENVIEVDLDQFRTDILKIKGIGEVKANVIVEILKNTLEGKKTE